MDFFFFKVGTRHTLHTERHILHNYFLHSFRSKYSLRNRANTRNNKRVVFFSVANTVSDQKRAYFDVTSGNFDIEVHEDKMFGRQDILQFFSEESPAQTCLFYLRRCSDEIQS